MTRAAAPDALTPHPSGGVNRVVLVGSARTAVLDAHGPRLGVSDDATPWVPPNINPDDDVLDVLLVQPAVLATTACGPDLATAAFASALGS